MNYCGNLCFVNGCVKYYVNYCATCCGKCVSCEVICGVFSEVLYKQILDFQCSVNHEGFISVNISHNSQSTTVCSQFTGQFVCEILLFCVQLHEL